MGPLRIALPCGHYDHGAGIHHDFDIAEING
jgi:hypothetical protein